MPTILLKAKRMINKHVLIDSLLVIRYDSFLLANCFQRSVNLIRTAKTTKYICPKKLLHNSGEGLTLVINWHKRALHYYYLLIAFPAKLASPNKSWSRSGIFWVSLMTFYCTKKLYNYIVI